MLTENTILKLLERRKSFFEEDFKMQESIIKKLFKIVKLLL